MAKKKTRRKKASKKSMWEAAVKQSKRAVLGKRTRRKRRMRLNLGTLGRKDSGTTKSHKPLKVLEKRLSRLSKIVAARKKNPSKWK